MTAASKFALLALIGLLGACSRQAPPAQAAAPAAPPLQPLATVKQVMLGLTIPASNSVFAVAAEAPKDDAAWEKVQLDALMLAESGNLLMLGARAADQQGWMEHARALIDAANVAAQAAAAKDADKVGEAGNTVLEACTGCHQLYMKPADGA